MKNLTILMLVLVLGGCGNKAQTVDAARAEATVKEIDERDVAIATRAGHRINLGLEAYHSGQLSDKDLIEIRSQLHNSIQSNIAALKMLKDMNDAEDLARLEAGLMDPPMTAEQRALRLAELRAALDKIKADEASRKAQEVVDAKPK